MIASRLKAIHVIIIGSLACVIVVVGLYFLIIKGCCEQIKSLKAELQKYEQTWNEKASVEAQLETAKQQYRLANYQLEKYLKEKMPPISFQKREEGMIALWKEQAEVLGPILQHWPRKTGVMLASNVQVPAPPVDPNAINTTLIQLDIGDFQVNGDFRTILSHIRSWNKFKRLVMIGPVNLTGPSPGMTAQYHVTVYIFPRGEAGPTVPMASSAQGAAAGGMPGPMMAMPGPAGP